MIQIVNWILTRRCNLKCDYCAIVKDYYGMPEQYPNMKHYKDKEMSTETVLNALANFKILNPDMFHIFYGGEPLLRNDLADIINFCNDNEIYYTIISNNTPEIQKRITDLFNKVKYIEGFTSSVDPIALMKMPDYIDMSALDIIKKSTEGLKRLKQLQAAKLVKDVVAEITVTNENWKFLEALVTELSRNEIYSDITFVDIAKSPYYDFSNVTNEDFLVKPTFELAKMLNRMLENDHLLIHMKDVLLPWMFNTLPSNFDCCLENSVHNVTVDADGTMRLCLRIRGVVTPTIHVSDIFEITDRSKGVTNEFYQLLMIDKKRYCQLCNHSCLMMSQHLNKNSKDVGSLIHVDKRVVDFLQEE